MHVERLAVESAGQAGRHAEPFLCPLRIDSLDLAGQANQPRQFEIRRAPGSVGSTYDGDLAAGPGRVGVFSHQLVFSMNGPFMTW
jgi:hypothetical protein